MKTQKFVLSVALLGLATACGGSSNGKLDRRVSQAHLAPVSAAERSGEADAQRDFFLSEWQVAFTEGQVRTAKLDLDIAKNKLASAKLAVKNAKLELSVAEEANDQKAIAEKRQAEKVATLQIEMHKASIEHAKQSKRYLEQRLNYEQRGLRSREASVELARANSLQAAGIRPPKFDAKKYKAQHTERTASEKAAKASVTTEQMKLAAVEKKLLAARNAVLTAEGNPILEQTPALSKPMEPLEGDKPDEKSSDTDDSTPSEESTESSEDTEAVEDTEDVDESAAPAPVSTTPTPAKPTPTPAKPTPATEPKS